MANPAQIRVTWNFRNVQGPYAQGWSEALIAVAANNPQAALSSARVLTPLRLGLCAEGIYLSSVTARDMNNPSTTALETQQYPIPESSSGAGSYNNLSLTDFPWTTLMLACVVSGRNKTFKHFLSGVPDSATVASQFQPTGQFAKNTRIFFQALRNGSWGARFLTGGKVPGFVVTESTVLGRNLFTATNPFVPGSPLPKIVLTGCRGTWTDNGRKGSIGGTWQLVTDGAGYTLQDFPVYSEFRVESSPTFQIATYGIAAYTEVDMQRMISRKKGAGQSLFRGRLRTNPRNRRT